jgi:hypothetical protein
MLPRVRNHYREQDQSRRVAQDRDASRVGGHRCITARLVLKKRLVSLFSRTTLSAPANARAELTFA